VPRGSIRNSNRYYTQKIEIEKRFFAGLHAIITYFAEMTHFDKKAGHRIHSTACYSALELP
jgi:hypothetical protein